MSKIHIALEDIKNIVTDAVEIGTLQTLVKLGKLKPFLNKREAYAMYGRTIVDRWIKEGLIRENKDGANTSSVRLDRIELETIAKSSNRATYLSVQDRNL